MEIPIQRQKIGILHGVGYTSFGERNGKLRQDKTESRQGYIRWNLREQYGTEEE
jgi:hypothetical protein